MTREQMLARMMEIHAAASDRAMTAEEQAEYDRLKRSVELMDLSNAGAGASGQGFVIRDADAGADWCAVLHQLVKDCCPDFVYRIPVIHKLPGINAKAPAHIINLAHTQAFCRQCLFCGILGLFLVFVIGIFHAGVHVPGHSG